MATPSSATDGYHNFAGWTVTDEDYYSGTNHSGATSDGSGSLTVAMDGSEFLQLIQSSQAADVTLSTYRWLMGSLLVPDWTPTTDEVTVLLFTENFAGTDKGPKLYAKESGSGYVVQLRESNGSTILGTGSTEFSFATEYEYRIESNGSFVVLDFGTAGSMSEEVVANYTEQMDARVRFTCSNVNSAVDVTYKAFGYRTATERQKRHRTISVVGLPHDDNTPQVDEYPTISSGTDKSAMVDDYDSGGADGDTTYIASDIGAGQTEGQTLVTPNVTLGNVKALKVTLEHKILVADKSAAIGALIGDGSSGEHSHTATDAQTVYHFQRAIFDTDANGNDWTQARLNNCEIGHEITADAAAEDVTNTRLTAIHAEALGAVLDAPAGGAGTDGVTPWISVY